LTTVEILGRLATSLAIGLLIGLERGWRRRDEPEGARAAGLRTLGLTGLLGGVLALMSPVVGPALVPAGFVTVALVLSVFQALEARATSNASATGVVGGLLGFAWGAYAVLGLPAIAVAGAVATTAVLAFKEPLHRWIQSLSWNELRALLVLLIMTALVLPLLPDHTVDPWSALNPRRIWLLTVLIAGLSFVGYFALRVLGGRGGLILSAFAGGLASSTATTVNFARLAKDHRPICGWLAGGTLIAGAVMGVRVLVMAAAISGAFAQSLAAPLAAFALVSGASGALLLSRSSITVHERREPMLSNPVEVGTALRFGALIALIMLLAKVLATSVGAVGIYGLAALSGLADVDSLTLSVSGMAGHELISRSAALAVLLAVAANTVAKTVIAGVAGTLRHGLLVGIASAAAVIAALATYLIAP
jgi:uncharacterized membrane protein (DUF4010 family)